MKNLYESLDYFMVRTPTKPINTYNNYLINNNLLDYLNDNHIKESIFLSSKSLYKPLFEKEIFDTKTQLSFFKYFNRMCQRSTPFGLFSSVGTGEFGENTSIIIKEFKKFPNIDITILLNIINNIKSNKDIFDEFLVKINPSIKIINNRVENLYFINTDTEHLTSSNISIQYTSALNYIFSLIKSPIKLKSLYTILYNNLPHIPKIYIEHIISELLDKKFLITELDYSLPQKDNLDYLIKILNNRPFSKEYIVFLKTLKDKISSYKKTSLGLGFTELREIDNYITRSNITSKVDTLNINSLQVDTGTDFKTCILENKIRNTLTKFINFMCKFSSLCKISLDYNNYKNRFIEEYGTNTLISLSTVVNQLNGISIPNNLSKYDLIKGTNFNSILSILYRQLFDSISNNCSEIILKDSSFSDIFNNYGLENDLTNLPLSLELFFSLNEINSNTCEIFISPAVSSLGAGRTFGRFTNLFNQNIKDQLKEINTLEKNIYNCPSTSTIELVDNMSIGKYLNVSNTLDFRDSHLNLSTWSSNSNDLDLDDVYIGIDNNDFFLWSKKLNKELIITKNNMLNRNLKNNLYKFLLEIYSHKNIFVFYEVINSIKSYFPVIPRFRYENIIFFPKTWYLTKVTLNLPEKIQFSDFRNSFEIYSEKYNLPDLFYLEQQDNRLLLRKTNDLDLNILFLEYKKFKILKLTEKDFNMNNSIIKDINNQIYNSEFVLPFIRTKKNNFNNKKFTYFDSLCERKFSPLNNWIYLNIFCNKSCIDEILVNNIYQIIKKYSNHIEKSFFIRYISETNNHIRLRIKENNTSNKIFFPLIGELDLLSKKNIINSFNIDTYKREIERYGGIKNYDLIEDFFNFDSLTIYEILSLFKDKNFNLSKKIVATINIIKLLEDLGLTYSEQFSLFDDIVCKKSFRNEFKLLRNELIYLSNSNNNWENLKSTSSGIVLFEKLILRKSSLNKLSISIINANNNTNNIILSLVHMSCNRLLGVDRSLEREIMSYVRHTLYSLKYFNK